MHLNYEGGVLSRVRGLSVGLRGAQCCHGYDLPPLARPGPWGRAPPQGVPEAGGHATGEPAHRPAEAAQDPPVLLEQAHIIFELGWRHLQVPGVPEDPPDQTEEDDDGPRVDEQVVEEDGDEHPEHQHQQTHDVEAHRQPEAAGAAAQTPGCRGLHERPQRVSLESVCARGVTSPGR